MWCFVVVIFLSFQVSLLRENLRGDCNYLFLEQGNKTSILRVAENSSSCHKAS